MNSKTRKFSGRLLVVVVSSLVSLLHSLQCIAEESQEYIEFHTTNFQALHGLGFKIGPSERQIFTLEHANRWRYGDFYGFVDHSTTNNVGIYGEVAPRFSLSRLGIFEIENSVVDDVFVATTLEFGRGGLRRYLYGLGVNLKVPGFVYFKVNGYQRDNPDITGKTYQATITWEKRFSLSSMKFIFEGFIDLAGGEGDSESNQLVVPRLLVDLGSIVNMPEKSLYVGLEYQYWHNKFGRAGVTESVPQLQVKLVL